MAKADINRKQLQWDRIKEKEYDLVNLSSANKKYTKEFLKDFELGVNVPSSSRGKRTAGTLLKLRSICVYLDEKLKKDFDKIQKIELHQLFADMFEGKILKQNGTPFKDIGDYVKNTKTFLNWMLKTKKISEDITEDLSRASYKKTKPAWVYLTHEQVKQLIDNARGDYRALILFLYDSGMRPQELFRLRVGDISFGKDVLVNIPQFREDGTRVSKTFERTIKLKQAGNLIKQYIETQGLKSDDLLVVSTQFAFNKYLRTLSKKLFGEKLTKARGYTHKLRLYDIRHLSAIFWLDKYKRNSDLMFRMGWSREDKIFYYSEFLGRRDKIDDEDMITVEDKTRYEKEIERLSKKSEQTNELLFKLAKHLQGLGEDSRKEFAKMINEMN
jgi:integrase